MFFVFRLRSLPYFLISYWSGQPSNKISCRLDPRLASIFFFYKATAATALGITAAVVADVFFALNLLPGFGAQGRSCWWGAKRGCTYYRGLNNYLYYFGGSLL